MSQPKVQAPYVPGQKEPVDLVPEVEDQESSGRSGAKSAPGKFISFFGSPGDGEGKDGREKQQGDYYTPVATEVVNKGNFKGKPGKDLDGNQEGAEMNDLYSPEAGVDIATTDKQFTPQNKSSTDFNLLNSL